MKSFLHSLRFEWAAPLFLLLVCILSFGLLLPWLGYYWDDWTVIYLTRTQGVDGLRTLFSYDRPFSLWMYIFANAIGGDVPLQRHLLAFAMRWLSVVGLWWVLRSVWHGQARLAVWAAALFAVYPLFLQQPIGLTYTQLYLLYFLYFLSIGLTIAGCRSKRLFFPFMAISWLICALQSISVEYYVGLELFRLIALWIVLEERYPQPKDRLGATIRIWLPFALLAGGIAIWRLFFLKLPEDVNAPVLLHALKANPLDGLLNLLQSAWRDLFTALILTWFKTLPQELFNLGEHFNLYTWSVIAATAILAGIFLFALEKYSGLMSSVDKDENEKWLKQLLVISVVLVLAGLLPIWIAGREIGVGFYGDRFGLPAMFGASLFWVALIQLMVRTPKQRIILFSLLIGLSAGLHFRTANDYRLDWLNQKQFYWQLFWRAPAIAPQTALISDESPLRFVNGYSLAAAINTLYDAKPVNGKLAYWFVDAYDAAPTKGGNLENFLAGEEMGFAVRSLAFQGSTLNTLMFSYQPSQHCLWILTPQDAHYIGISDKLRDFLPAANIDRILPHPASENIPPKQIFGEEPPYSWCTFYQKARLAQQYGNWQQVISLWEEANRKGFKPLHPFEIMPFIDAFLHSSQWKKAAELSRTAYRQQLSTQALICALWKPYISDLGNSPDISYWLDVKERVKCP